jgi:hypothetical protein
MDLAISRGYENSLIFPVRKYTVFLTYSCFYIFFKKTEWVILNLVYFQTFKLDLFYI